MKKVLLSLLLVSQSAFAYDFTTYVKCTVELNHGTHSQIELLTDEAGTQAIILESPGKRDSSQSQGALLGTVSIEADVITFRRPHGIVLKFRGDIQGRTGDFVINGSPALCRFYKE